MKKCSLIILIIALFACFSQARIINFPGDYSFLQEAVAAANTGDIIVVAAAIEPYKPIGTIEVSGKSITIRSEDPSNPDVVANTRFTQAADSSGTVTGAFDIEGGATVNIEGLTFEGYEQLGGDGANGKTIAASEADPDWHYYNNGNPGSHGKGVVFMVTETSTLKLKNVVIKDSSYIGGDGGDGIDADFYIKPLDDGSGDTEEVIVRHGGHGGWPGKAYGVAVYAEDSSTVSAVGCTFKNLTAEGGNSGNGGNGRVYEKWEKILQKTVTLQDADGADVVVKFEVSFRLDLSNGGLGGATYYSNTDPDGYYKEGELEYERRCDKTDEEVDWVASGYAASPVGDASDSDIENGFDIDIDGDGTDDIKIDLNYDYHIDDPENPDKNNFNWPGPTVNSDDYKLNRYTQYSARGAAFHIGDDIEAEFSRCTFENCETFSGQTGVCGINSTTGGLEIPDSRHYMIDNFGGAVFCADSSKVEFRSCDFIANEANNDIDPGVENDDSYVGFGGAVAAINPNNVRLIGCLLSENRSAVGGGCFVRIDKWDIDHEKVEILDSKIESNNAYLGAGLFAAATNLEMLRTMFTQNTTFDDVAIGRGGGMYLWNSDAWIVDSIYQDNVAGTDGGGIYVGGDTNTVKFTNLLLAGNEAVNRGGGIYATSNVNTEIHHATVANNEASAGSGMSLYYGAYANIKNSIFWGNSSSDPNDKGQIELGVFEHPENPPSFDYDGDGDVDSDDHDKRSCLEIDYSNIKQGQHGVAVDYGIPSNSYDDPNLVWGSNMMAGFASSDPKFESGNFSDYYLHRDDPENEDDSDSYCLGEGLPFTGNDQSDQDQLMSYYRHSTDPNSSNILAVFDSGVNQPDLGFYSVFAEGGYGDENEYFHFPNGDFDFSGLVDSVDYTLFLDRWLDSCSFPDWCEGIDLDMSGTVDLPDQAGISGNYENDVIAPWPNRLQWKIEPRSSLGSSSVYMQVVDARDNTGCPIVYTFKCYASDDSVVSSALMIEEEGGLTDPNSREYEFTGLTQGEEYYFEVFADDRLSPAQGVDQNDPATYNTGTPTTRVYVIVGDDYSPPSPTKAQWDSNPNPASYTSVRMSAVEATDLNGVEYYFRYVSGKTNLAGDLIPGNDSLWQDSREYVDTGLTPGATYTYTVQTRDKVANHATVNTGVESDEATVVLPELEEFFDFDPPSTPSPVYSGQELDNYASGVYHYMIARANSNDDSGIVYYGFECKEESGFNTMWYQEDSEIHNGGYMGSTYALWFADGKVFLRIKVRSLENGAAALPLNWRVVAVDPVGRKSYSDWYYLNDTN